MASLIVPISAESRYKMINDDLKEFIGEVCAVLEIPVPNISDDFRVFENNTRMAVLAIEKNVPTLYLNDRMETRHMIEVRARQIMPELDD